MSNHFTFGQNFDTSSAFTLNKVLTSDDNKIISNLDGVDNLNYASNKEEPLRNQQTKNIINGYISMLPAKLLSSKRIQDTETGLGNGKIFCEGDEESSTIREHHRSSSNEFRKMKQLNERNNRKELSNALANSTHNGISRGQPYENTYCDSFQVDMDDPQREKIFFLPDDPISIQIIGHEEEPSLVLLHTKLYIINIRHADFSWTIKRKYKNFLKLYEAYTLFKTKMNIKNATEHLTTFSQSNNESNTITSNNST